MIKIIFCDLDGTLLGSSLKISSANREAIAAYRRQGGLFSICTGRYLQAGELVASALALTEPCVYADGVMIKRLQDEEPISVRPLVTQYVHQLVAFVHAHDLLLELYTYDGYYIENHDPLFDYHAGILSIFDSNLSPEITSFHPDRIKTATWLKGVVIAKSDDEVSIIREYEKSQPYFRFSGAKPPDSAHAHLTFFNVVHPSVSKGTAVQKVLDMLNVDPKDVMAIGDSTNDESLFDNACYRIAMQNATPILKERATWISSDADDDGVARAIERYMD